MGGVTDGHVKARLLGAPSPSTDFLFLGIVVRRYFNCIFWYLSLKLSYVFKIKV